jgi:CheY-like chemotaxis protein
VLSGFISNALKYTEQGSIHFGCEQQREGLLFYTKDTGMGIPEAEQQKIFDRFYRGDEAQMKAIRGNGLGLSIAKGLVELMSGELIVQSEPGKGSVFSFSIPVVFSQHAYEKPIAVKTSPLSFNRILVAEDETDNFELIQFSLEPICQYIDHARSGKEVLVMIQEKVYDVVIMDLKMPVMDGFEATARLHKQYPQIPVIALSAFQQTEDKNRAKEAGCIAFLEKPFQTEQLYKILSTLRK